MFPVVGRQNPIFFSFSLQLLAKHFKTGYDCLLQVPCSPFMTIARTNLALHDPCYQSASLNSLKINHPYVSQ
jgi:hypothetical protein